MLHTLSQPDSCPASLNSGPARPPPHPTPPPSHTLLRHATGFSSTGPDPQSPTTHWLPQAPPAAHASRLNPCALPRHCLLAGASRNGGLATAPEPPPAGGSGGVPLVPIIGAVAGVLAVAFIATVVLLARRARMRNNLAAQAAAGGPPTYPGMPPQGAYGAAYGAAGASSAYASSGRMTDVEVSQGMSQGMSLPGSVSAGSGGGPQVLFHMGPPPVQPPLYHGPPGTGNAYSGGMPGGMAAPGQPGAGLAYRI